jgi:hypothetical protein
MAINAQMINVLAVDRDQRPLGNTLIEFFSDDGEKLGQGTTKGYVDAPVTFAVEPAYQVIKVRATVEKKMLEVTIDLKQTRNYTFHFNDIQIHPPAPPAPPPTTPSQGTGGTGHTGLLVKLGKIAGIGGIGVGTFLILLRAFVFPTLAAAQASLLMMLSYGIAVVGLIIWAAQATTRRYLPILLAIFAIAMAWIGASVLRPGDLSYHVRVTVVSPSQTPVDDAHVWSTLGGESKKVEGGWEIAIPATSTNRDVTIYAELAQQGWRGNVGLSLGGEHSPSVSIQLKKSGELPVRGIVLDKLGNAVPNAHVSVVGYGKDAVSTDANGGFELPTHTYEGDTVQLHAEKAPYVAANYPEFKVGSGPAILVLKDTNQARNNVVPPTPKVEHTGDQVIDRVLANLASLKQLKQPPAESQLAAALAPLFSRPAFYHGIREEDWRYFLYPLCRTRLLLEEYLGSFKSSVEVAKNIQQAIVKMVQLQNEVAGLYGPTFHITEHISRYISSRSDFINNLPPVVVDPKPQFFDDRDKEIHDIRELLLSAGFPIRELTATAETTNTSQTSSKPL